MKPNFALSLSLQGITLLRRLADGWEIVGETHLDAPDLVDALNDLRSNAQHSDVQDLGCALIIPDDQIRYLKVPATGTDTDETDALNVLERATPYSLDQLAFDTTHTKDFVHIAAVAKGTLQEAEKFALEHGFDPVCFVAKPKDQKHPGSPYFGPSSSVDPDTEVEWDNEAISIVETSIGETNDANTTDSTDAGHPGEDLAAAIPFVSRRRQIDTATTEHSAPAIQPTPEKMAENAGQSESTAKEEADLAEMPVAPAAAGNEAQIISGSKDTAAELKPLKTDIAAASQPDTLSAEGETGPVLPAFEAETETERMTIFGAREQVAAQKPVRRVGYWIAAVLALVVFGASAWAMLSKEGGLAGLFGDTEPEAELALAPTIEAPDVQSRSPTLSETAPSGPQAEPDRVQPTTDAPAVSDTTDQTGEQPAEITPADPQNQNTFASSDIWQQSPEVPTSPETDDLNALYEVSIDRTDLEQDAVALLGLPMLDTDQPMDAINAPAAAGTTFDLDEDGLVIPTPEGAVSPEGITVFSGRPPVVPPTPPTRFEAEPEDNTARERLATLRPKNRPTDLLERAERAQLGGFTREELGDVRPRLRPVTEKQEAETDETPTAQAIAASPSPKSRPRNFSTKVAKTREREAGPSSQVSAAVVAPKTVSPRIPSSASVARRATLDNAINLRRVNLIGVFGTPSNRRALVRLPNGRYKKIKIGDRVDGGRVVAIGESELRYQKGGRNVTLKMPRG